MIDSRWALVSSQLSFWNSFSSMICINSNNVFHSNFVLKRLWNGSRKNLAIPKYHAIIQTLEAGQCTKRHNTSYSRRVKSQKLPRKRWINWLILDSLMCSSKIHHHPRRMSSSRTIIRHQDFKEGRMIHRGMDGIIPIWFRKETCESVSKLLLWLYFDW